MFVKLLLFTVKKKDQMLIALAVCLLNVCMMTKIPPTVRPLIKCTSKQHDLLLLLYFVTYTSAMIITSVSYPFTVCLLLAVAGPILNRITSVRIRTKEWMTKLWIVNVVQSQQLWIVEWHVLFTCSWIVTIKYQYLFTSHYFHRCSVSDSSLTKLVIHVIIYSSHTCSCVFVKRC